MRRQKQIDEEHTISSARGNVFSSFVDQEGVKLLIYSPEIERIGKLLLDFLRGNLTLIIGCGSTI